MLTPDISAISSYTFVPLHRICMLVGAGAVAGGIIFWRIRQKKNVSDSSVDI